MEKDWIRIMQGLDKDWVSWPSTPPSAADEGGGGGGESYVAAAPGCLLSAKKRRFSIGQCYTCAMCAAVRVAA